MSETTFGLLFALFSAILTGGLLLISRFNQRLTDPSSTNQQWIWSDQLDRTGRWLLVAGVVLMLTGFLIGDMRFIPIAVPAQISAGSMLAGFLCLVMAIPFISSALVWRLHLRYGLHQLTTQLLASINQHLPEPPANQTRLQQVLHFSGQFCVGMVIIGWGFLRVIAASGVLAHNEEINTANDIASEYDHHYDSNKYKSIYLYDEQDI